MVARVLHLNWKDVDLGKNMEKPSCLPDGFYFVIEVHNVMYLIRVQKTLKPPEIQAHWN